VKVTPGLSALTTKSFRGIAGGSMLNGALIVPFHGVLFRPAYDYLAYEAAPRIAG
jgi:hypothetical protein